MARAGGGDCVEQIADEVIVERLIQRHHAFLDQRQPCAGASKKG